MGAWGPGLYSNDFALDLRATLRAISRLPFEPQRLLEIACETAPSESSNANNEDHATFWLVVADQFQKRGISSQRAMHEALSIIDSGSDLSMLRTLGMPEPAIRKRTQKNHELRSRLMLPEVRPRTTVFSKPKPFVLNLGEVYAYPTHAGNGINPYCVDYRARFNWTPDAWSAFVPVQVGRAFGYLPWYSVLTLRHELPELPTLARLGDATWVLDYPGTCSATHKKRLEVQSLGTLAIDFERLEAALGKAIPDGTYQAVNDISIANSLHTLSEARKPYDGMRYHVERLPSVKTADFAQ